MYLPPTKTASGDWRARAEEASLARSVVGCAGVQAAVHNHDSKTADHTRTIPGIPGRVKRSCFNRGRELDAQRQRDVHVAVALCRFGLQDDLLHGLPQHSQQRQRTHNTK